MTPSPWPDDPQHLRLKPPTRIAVASPCLPLPALATHGKVHASSMSLPVAFPSPLPLHSQWLPRPPRSCYGCLCVAIAPTRPPALHASLQTADAHARRGSVAVGRPPCPSFCHLARASSLPRIGVIQPLEAVVAASSSAVAVSASSDLMWRYRCRPLLIWL